MALSFDISQCSRKTAQEWNDGELFLASSLTVVTGIPHIDSEDTARRFYNRVNAYEKLHGAFQTEVGEDGKHHDKRLRIGDVEKWVGLRTNASEYTAHIFGRHLLKDIKENW